MSADAPSQEKANHYGQSLTVTVKEGRLTIAIGVDVLAHAVRFSDWANPWNDEADDNIRTFAIVNPEQFAKDVRLAMTAEREDGSTPLSDFLDNVSEAAVDDGSEACEYDQRIGHGQRSPLEPADAPKERTTR